MSSRHHIDDFMRGRIIGKIEEGRKITDVAREFDIAHSVVSRLWKSFKTTGMCSRRHGEVVLEQVANQFLAASGKQISRKTVARRLRGGGLYARRPVVCVPLTRQHRTARLQWCREHHNWTEQDWACVLFSDESRFSLSSDCRRQLIWRESGTAYPPENIQEKDRYPTCSIMVWAGIMINGRTRLHVVANGTMTDQRYIDEVLLPHVLLFRGAVGDKFVFMDDNATCHRTLAVQDCLDSEGIQRLVWPARSPHLNPIANVWDVLGRQVAGRNYPPTNKNTLIRALTEEWDELPQQLLDNVVQSMDLNRFLETGSAGRRPGQGRRRATTPNKDRYLVLTARRYRNMNATLLQQHLRSATGTTVSTQIVRNWLHGVGLYARRPMSRFSVHLNNRRIFIWRDHGSRNNPAFVHESVRFGGGGVLVYGGISIEGRTDLYIIRDGPLTTRRYRDEILRPIVVPYAAAIGDDFILIDDNFKPHRANLVEDFLFVEGIVQMEWPACSPDMNPIEHVWNALGRRVAGRQPPPQTLQELERALLEEWDRISKLVINSLIDSMP
ncbi:transposable element Tcb2 transposase [Trichonephila clavipes]|nr:transposable element Tcb2 transposase [Trichonephila clavipes]